MKRLCIALLLALCSAPVFADWVKVAESIEVTDFLDPDTRVVNGSLVKVWTLTDMKSPQMVQGKPTQSMKALLEYDCSANQYRTLYMAGYANHMGAGVTNFAGNANPRWVPIVPQSVNAKKYQIICGSR